MNTEGKPGGSGSIVGGIVGLIAVGLILASLVGNSANKEVHNTLPVTTPSVAKSEFRDGGGIKYSHVYSTGAYMFSGRIGGYNPQAFQLINENYGEYGSYNFYFKYIEPQSYVRPEGDETAIWNQSSGIMSNIFQRKGKNVTCFSDDPVSYDKAGHPQIFGDCFFKDGTSLSEALLAYEDHWRLR